MEIGDVFVIVNNTNVKCKYPNKRFIIKGFSGTGLTVYYDDNRTNNNCKCIFCEKKIKKDIYHSLINIVETKAQRERDLKLKIILGKYEKG